MAAADLSHADDAQNEPLVSNRFTLRLTLSIAALVILTAVISLLGRNYGRELALAGHSEDTEIVHSLVGADLIAVPMNMIRFAEQRQSGRRNRLDLYLAWPDMAGYSAALAPRFNSVDASGGLVFMQFSQSVMTRDMSGRFEPIYSHLMAGPAEPGPAGLTLHRMKPESGFVDDVLLSARLEDGKTYVVRCRLGEAADAASGNADCQRDIHVGGDLTLLYRFSRKLLPHWAELDRAMTGFAKAHIQK